MGRPTEELPRLLSLEPWLKGRRALYLGACSPESVTWMYRLGAREVAIQSEQEFEDLDVRVIQPQKGWSGLGSQAWDIVIAHDLGALLARDPSAATELPKLLADDGLVVAVLPAPGDHVGLDMLTHRRAEKRLDYADVVSALEPHFEELSAMAQVPVLAYLMTGTSSDPTISFDGRIASLEDEAPTYHVLCAAQKLPQDLGNRLTTISFDSLSARVGGVVNAMQRDLQVREQEGAEQLQRTAGRVEEVETEVRRLEQSQAEQALRSGEQVAATEARIEELNECKRQDREHTRSLTEDNATLRQRVVTARVELERRAATRHRFAKRCKRLALELQRRRLDAQEAQGRLRQLERRIKENPPLTEPFTVLPERSPRGLIDERLQQELQGAVAEEEALHDQIIGLREELEGARRQAQTQQANIDAGEGQLKDLEGVRSELDSQRRIVEAQRSLADERGESLREYKVQLRDLRSTEASLKARAFELTAELSNLKGRHSELEQALNADQLKLASAEEDAARHAAAAENLRQVVDTLRQSLAELRGDEGVAVVPATEEPAAMALEIERQRGSYQAALAALTEQGREIDALDRSNEDLRLELQRARAAITSRGADGDSPPDNNALHARLSAALRDRAKLEEEVFSLRPLRRITEHQSEDLAGARTEAEHQRGRARALAEELAEVRPLAENGAGFDALNAAHGDLLEEVGHLRSSRDAALERAAQHEQTLKTALAEHQQAASQQAAAVTALQAASNELSDENVLLGRRLAETTDHAEVTAAAATQSEQELASRLLEAEELLVAADAHSAEKESTFAEEISAANEAVERLKSEAVERLKSEAAERLAGELEEQTKSAEQKRQAEASAETVREDLAASKALRADLEHRVRVQEERIEQLVQAGQAAADRVAELEDSSIMPEVMAAKDDQVAELTAAGEEAATLATQQLEGLQESQRTVRQLLDTQGLLQTELSDRDEQAAGAIADLAAASSRGEELEAALAREQAGRQQAEKTLGTYLSRQTDDAQQRLLNAEESGRTLAEKEGLRAGQSARRETSLQHALDDAHSESVTLRQELAMVQAERETNRRKVRERDAKIDELNTRVDVAHREQERAAETMTLSHSTGIQALVAEHQVGVRQEQADRHNAESVYSEEIDTLRRALDEAQREERQMARLLNDKVQSEREQWHLAIARRTARLVELADRLESVASTEGAHL